MSESAGRTEASKPAPSESSPEAARATPLGVPQTAFQPGAGLSPSAFLALQRTVGNRAARSLLEQRRGPARAVARADGSPETTFGFEGQDITFEVVPRAPYRRAWAQGLDPSLKEPITADIDEILAVGRKDITRQEAYARARSAAIRELKDAPTNRIVKHLRDEVSPTARALKTRSSSAVSVVDSPGAIFGRPFSQVKEMRQIFAQALRKWRSRTDLSPTQLKEAINGEVRAIIETGTSDAAKKVRVALEDQNWTPRLRALEVAAEDAGAGATGAGSAGGASGIVGTVFEGLGKGLAVVGSASAGWQTGQGIEGLIEGRKGAGIDLAEGGANLFLTIGTPLLVRGGALVADAAAGAGAVTFGAGLAASGSVALAAETARAASEGRKTPIEIADEYYGSHVSNLGWYVDAAAQAVLPKSGQKAYEATDDAVHDWYRRHFL
jgi:hypothetical protein